MKGFFSHLCVDASANKDFRRVAYTSKYTQLVYMSIPPETDISPEVHKDNDQLFLFAAGEGKCIVDGNIYHVAAGDALIVPVGASHNIINTSKTFPLQISTLYSPPHHQDGLVRTTKAEATKGGVDFDGKTTE